MLIKTRKRGISLHTPFCHIYFLSTQGNSRELKGTHGNSWEALIEVMEGKNSGKRIRKEKTQEKGQRGEIQQILEEKRKHRSALRALNI